MKEKIQRLLEFLSKNEGSFFSDLLELVEQEITVGGSNIYLFEIKFDPIIKNLARYNPCLFFHHNFNILIEEYEDFYNTNYDGRQLYEEVREIFKKYSPRFFNKFNSVMDDVAKSKGWIC